MTDRDDLERELARNQPKHHDTDTDVIEEDAHVPAGRELDPDSVRPVKSLDEDGLEVDDEPLDSIRTGE